MSEDRLEKVLEAMKRESVSPEQLDSTRIRVWEKIGHAGPAVCAEFQLDFHDYLDGRLAGNRRLLLEDHLSRCPLCRDQLVVQRGEKKIVPMPQRRASRWPRWGTWAAAAALIFGLLYMGRHTIDALLAPSGPRATVASITGGLYLIPEGALKAGSAIGEDDVIRTGPGAHAVLRLGDGSLVEVNERTELSVRATWSGQSVHLQRGDIIVQAAKQRRGRLHVQTRDTFASVKGTVFAVSSGLSGTLVSVVEGSVAVSQPGAEVILSAGEQAASNPALADSVQAAVSWSPDAETYIELLASFAKVEK
jgi:predicted anti-sigma-YlaC factor YlaD